MRTFHVEFDLEVEDDDVRQLPEFEVMVRHALDDMPMVPYLDHINFSVTPTEEVNDCIPQGYNSLDHSIRGSNGEL